MLLTNRTVLLSLIALAGTSTLVACGDDDVTPPADGGGDGGMMMMTDSGSDGGMMVVNVCDEVRPVTGEMGTTTITGDTSAVTSRPRDLGTDCGNADAARFAPQEIIAYTVPGTGPVGLRLSLRNAGTPDDFLAVLQVRDACETIPADVNYTCFLTQDDDWRPQGGLTADGGSTIYIVVTGYSDPPSGLTVVTEGAWELTVETVANTAPTLSEGAAWYLADALELAVTGSDDGNIGVYQADLLDATGAAVDVNGDGAPDVLGGAFIGDVTGSPFTAYDRYAGLRESLMDAAVTQLSVVVYDEFGLASDPLMVSLRDALGVGDTCGDMLYCASALACESMMCAAQMSVTTACGGATAITLATPTTTTTNAMVTGSIPAAGGVVDPSCTAAPGGELFYSLAVPAGAFDLLARTDLAATADTDTVVSVRSDCADPTTEVACNDDIDLMGMTYSSELEVLDIAAGTYTLIVEQYGTPTAAGPVAMQVSLRPVLATGAACDMAGVMNRCAGAACAAGTCP